ncbi:unnamed protein product [Prunus armeniaca]|uniref:Uncharacterized protein n=1 Tax=Prunus armeniaca TaxID=36596 RepID=A0A6J5WSB3_PRUAR|nr:unnamed protein product [Prunus armeniaca]
MGGCASKPKEFDTARPEALPTESTRPEKADREAETTTDSTNVAANQEAVDTTNVEAEAPLVDLSEPKEEKEEEAAPVVVPAAAAEAAAAAEVVATQKPKEEKAADQVEVAATQLAEVNLVEAVKETKEKELLPAQEIKSKAKEEQPAAEIKPKAKEEEPAADIKPKAAPASEGKNKDAPILTV